MCVCWLLGALETMNGLSACERDTNYYNSWILSHFDSDARQHSYKKEREKIGCTHTHMKKINQLLTYGWLLFVNDSEELGAREREKLQETCSKWTHFSIVRLMTMTVMMQTCVQSCVSFFFSLLSGFLFLSFAHPLCPITWFSITNSPYSRSSWTAFSHKECVQMLPIFNGSFRSSQSARSALILGLCQLCIFMHSYRCHVSCVFPPFSFVVLFVSAAACKSERPIACLRYFHCCRFNPAFISFRFFGRVEILFCFVVDFFFSYSCDCERLRNCCSLVHLKFRIMLIHTHTVNIIP